MKKYIVFLLFLSCVKTPSSHQAISVNVIPTENLYIAMQNLVRVDISAMNHTSFNTPIYESFQCNGTIVDDYATVLTSAHCVSYSYNIKVTLFEFNELRFHIKQEDVEYDIYAISEKDDIAIIKPKIPFFINHHAIILTEYDKKPYISDTIYYVDRDLTLKSALISKDHIHILLDTGQSMDAFEMIAEPKHGNSGGPIFNEDGNVIGIFCAADFSSYLSYGIYTYDKFEYFDFLGVD